ncbi:hypothetical protein BC830DRAFT_1153866 [Chytriomyces sp. MP71]|nr:hypothetical protein BC830DRAFT_1153866 [Chytriomyces sp. MP71]
MASYFEEHDMEDPGRQRTKARDLNPDLGDFMGTASAASNGSRAPGGGAASLGEGESLRGLMDMFSSLQSSANVMANAEQRRLLEGLMSQLNQEAASGTGGKPPASKFFVRNLPNAKSPSTPCAICVEPFESNEDDPAKLLPCKHIFHKKCITPWLKLHNTCPFCRFELQTDDTSYEKDRKKRMKAEAKKRGLEWEDDEDEDFMYG